MNPAGAATVRVSARVFASAPDVPLTVRFVAPVAAVLLAVKVSVLNPVVTDGLKDAVIPAGNPDTLIATLPVNPFS